MGRLSIIFGSPGPSVAPRHPKLCVPRREKKVGVFLQRGQGKRRGGKETYHRGIQKTGHLWIAGESRIYPVWGKKDGVFRMP